MRQGPELYKWAMERAQEAAAAPATGLEQMALAIACAYTQGGIDALADEIERKRPRNTAPRSIETIGLG